MANDFDYHKLPQEVTDAIIDQLRDDRVTLRRSSLVSRGWLERSQCHLFGSIRVVEGDPSHWHFRNNFAAFHRFLRDDASERLCAQVRRLVIQGDQGSYDFPSRVILDRVLFILVLDKLPHLSSLTLFDVRFNDIEFVLPRRYKLDELVLDSVGSHSDSPRTIISFLDMFAHVGSLRTAFVDNWYETALAEGRGTPLKHDFKSGPLSLTLDNARIRGWTTVNCMLAILRNSKSMHTLRSLDVECTDMREIVSLGQVIRSVSNSLSHVRVDLSIAFRDEQDPVLIANSLDLSGVLDLESLHICIFPDLALSLTHSMVQTARASACLIHILSALPRSIRRITIELGPSDIVHGRFSLIDWEGLSSVEWKCFYDFDRLTILLRHGGSAEAAAEIRQRLRLLNEKMLHISIGPE